MKADTRGPLLFLTAMGRRTLPELKAIADRNDHRFFDCLDANEKSALALLLRKLTSSNGIQDVPVE